MLRPDERSHLLALLRPPTGCKLDSAVGTTFSLDLLSALMLPLSFAFFDWEHVNGEPAADPLALLEALRRYGDRFTIFCQSGQIRLPKNYQPLLTFLEPCIYDVVPPDPEGVFHPKVWALRFIAKNGEVRYRILCLSRNLTFDRCWDTVVALDGELLDRTNAIAANRPLADFVGELPALALRSVTRDRRQSIAKIADELKRVRFTWPEGFEEDKCRFWVGGLNRRIVAPFGEHRDKTLIVSPFLSDSVVRDFLDHSDETHLVSRPESLQSLPQKTLQDCVSVRTLASEMTEGADDEVPIVGKDEVLDGLHAKLFVVDRGWNTSVFTGSFNATVHALKHNVEFMIELVGKRSRFGVEQFLRQAKGETNFADLLQPYDPNVTPIPTDAVAQQLDELLQSTKRLIAAACPRLVVTPAKDPDSFNMSLEWGQSPRWPHPSIQVRAWPITQQVGRAQVIEKPVVFSPLSYGGLTPLTAFSITGRIGERSGESVFVMNLPLHGAPDDRQDRVVRSLIGNRDQLLRYILFLLASDDEAAASSEELRRLLQPDQSDAQNAAPKPYLLETMLRALHRDSTQLGRVASLLDVLRKAPGSSELLSDDFQEVWGPIWDAAQQAKAK
jgi:hypothetical protein